MTRITSGIISIYVASFLYLHVPFAKTLTVAGKDAPALFWNHLAIFGIFFVFVFFVLQRHVSSYAGHLQLILGTLALLGLVLIVFYHIVPIAPVYTLPALLQPYFATDTAFTAWLIAPLAILFF